MIKRGYVVCSINGDKQISDLVQFVYSIDEGDEVIQELPLLKEPSYYAILPAVYDAP